MYNFKEIEKKWQQKWSKEKIFKSAIDLNKPKFYTLDMFPYPSGAGLHVGHPLGYIATDIVARYKKLCGFNVLHPMGFDAFGLPAEQYAIQTGKHPADTTEINIKRYKEQLNRLGFSYDWDREIRTSDPSYYKWTQWIFIQLYNSWYNLSINKALPINQLLSIFENEGNVNVHHHGDQAEKFTSEQWEQKSPIEKESILQCYRLAFQKETTVNWCEELGTVLANDEIKDGKSERGGYPVTQKYMRQWYLRITAYSDRLLSGLDAVDWSESIKEVQRNWIGKSVGAHLTFSTQNAQQISVFSTRPDTIFGCTFLVLAPEHPLVNIITTPEQQQEVNEYIFQAQQKTERDRMINKTVSGAFTGAFAIHPFSQEKLPIYISEYVLAGYGTGAIMAVPAHDERDHAFAKKFQLPIIQVIAPETKDASVDVQEASYDAKEGILMNSANFNRLTVTQGTQAIIQLAEERGFGKRQTNFKLRDAGFSRQRYWGEPFPVYYKDNVPQIIDDLPIELPTVQSYRPSGNGESPLANNPAWVNIPEGRRETDTMPGYAGSSWYFLRYTDPKNDTEFASAENIKYWNQVDLYVGGNEHATGHLLYSRFWTKFLYDLGYIPFDEPFKKLVNQGMIQGESMLLVYDNMEYHIPVELVSKNGTLSKEKFLQLKQQDNRFENISLDQLNFVNEELQLISQVEKMSKTKHNVVNPDDICDEYGADTLRIYEMFLGPLQDSKPWSTKGIDGTHRFLKKLWSLFYDLDGNQLWTEDAPSPESLKTLHKTIKKITEDIENMSFNTSVAQFMICANELGQQKCHSKEILEPLLIVLSPFAPHITEELWHKLGNSTYISKALWPKFDEKYLTETTKAYPISINGKTRTTIEFDINTDKSEIEKISLENEIVQKWLEGKTPKKVIVVPGKIVNIVM